jgi:hypothetical protein
MKKQIMRAFATLGLLLTLAAASPATPAAPGAQRLVVNVPFEFVAGGKVLPAGRYTITRVVRDSGGALLIRSADGRASVTVMTNASEAGGETPQVSFKRYGERYFLARVWTPGVEAARTLPASGLEKQLRRELAKGERKKGGESNVAETVTINGGLR